MAVDVQVPQCSSGRRGVLLHQKVFGENFEHCSSKAIPAVQTWGRWTSLNWNELWVGWKTPFQHCQIFEVKICTLWGNDWSVKTTCPPEAHKGSPATLSSVDMEHEPLLCAPLSLCHAFLQPQCQCSARATALRSCLSNAMSQKGPQDTEWLAQGGRIKVFITQGCKEKFCGEWRSDMWAVLLGLQERGKVHRELGKRSWPRWRFPLFLSQGRETLLFWVCKISHNRLGLLQPLWPRDQHLPTPISRGTRHLHWSHPKPQNYAWDLGLHFPRLWKPSLFTGVCLRLYQGCSPSQSQAKFQKMWSKWKVVAGS